MHYDIEYRTAIEAVRSAASVCRAVQSQLDSTALKKDDRSPVTVADFGSQALICRALEEAFPDDPIIAEEDAHALQEPSNRDVLAHVVAEVGRIVPGADRDAVCRWINRGNASKYADRFWTLDPIDGTKGFLRGDQYAVALTLIVDGRVEVAALACPKLRAGDDTEGVVFAAHRGEGTDCLSLTDGGAAEPVRVSDVTSGSGARFCESVESAHSSHTDAAAVAEHLGIVKAPFRIDSQAKYGIVARGDAEIYLRMTKHTGYVEKIWDHASGALVIEEAGGRVTDLNGKPLDFSRGVRLELNVGIAATNGHLHDAVLEALESVLAPS